MREAMICSHLLKKPRKWNFLFVSAFWLVLRSIHPDVFCQKGVLKKFTKEHLFRSFFFNEAVDLILLHRCFFYEFSKIFQNTCFYRTPLVAPDLCRFFIFCLFFGFHITYSPSLMLISYGLFSEIFFLAIDKKKLLQWSSEASLMNLFRSRNYEFFSVFAFTLFELLNIILGFLSYSQKYRQRNCTLDTG